VPDSSEAAVLFNEILEDYLDDPPSKVYLKRCQRFLACPEMVCPRGLRLSSGSPLPFSAGLGCIGQQTHKEAARKGGGMQKI